MKKSNKIIIFHLDNHIGNLGKDYKGLNWLCNGLIMAILMMHSLNLSMLEHRSLDHWIPLCHQSEFFNILTNKVKKEVHAISHSCTGLPLDGWVELSTVGSCNIHSNTFPIFLCITEMTGKVFSSNQICLQWKILPMYEVASTRSSFAEQQYQQRDDCFAAKIK